MQSSDNGPPVRVWPPEVFEHEPAHGYFVRLAARNGAHSTAVFADAVGLNGRNPSIADLLDFCLRFPIRNREMMRASSPHEDGKHIFIGGQRFHKQRDWSMSKPRVCDACLAEGAYYRNWWDLMVVANCPIHDRPLLSGDGLSKLRWWCPSVGQMSDGRDLRALPVPRAAVIQPSWDSYVLGRMGVIEPLAVPFLDQIALCDVIECADLIGRAVVSGWKQQTPRRPPLHSDARRRCLSLAFDILRPGESSIEDFLEIYLSTIDRDYSRPRGVGFYGWLGEACRYLPHTSLSSAFKATMNTVAARKGVHRKRGRAPAGKIYTLKDLSKNVGVGTVPLLRIAIDLGLTERTRNRQLRHWFDDVALGVIREFIQRLVPMHMARSILGVTPEEFGALLAIGAVRETLRAKTGYMFDPKSLLQFAEDIKFRELAEDMRGRLEAKNCLIDAEARMTLLQKLGFEMSDLDVRSKILSSGLTESSGSAGLNFSMIVQPPSFC